MFWLGLEKGIVARISKCKLVAGVKEYIFWQGLGRANHSNTFVGINDNYITRCKQYVISM